MDFFCFDFLICNYFEYQFKLTFPYQCEPNSWYKWFFQTTF